jgi:ATP-dependent Clp protease ATP-binding subunit ClpA
VLFLLPALRVELSGTAESGSSLPIVDTADIERIVEAWTGIPVETMGQEEKGKLGELVRTWLQE